jgi:hypothetical protein
MVQILHENSTHFTLALLDNMQVNFSSIDEISTFSLRIGILILEQTFAVCLEIDA